MRATMCVKWIGWRRYGVDQFYVNLSRIEHFSGESSWVWKQQKKKVHFKWTHKRQDVAASTLAECNDILALGIWVDGANDRRELKTKLWPFRIYVTWRKEIACCMYVFDTGTRYTSMVIYVDDFLERQKNRMCTIKRRMMAHITVEIDVPGSKRFMRTIRIRIRLFLFNFVVFM